MPEDLLFYPHDLRAGLEAAVAKMRESIAQYSADRLLNSSEDDLVKYFVGLAMVEPVTLREAEITVAQQETKYDVSHRFEYAVWDRSQPAYVAATLVTMHIPFDGEADLFHNKASTWSMNPPRGSVQGSELVLSYRAPQSEVGGAKMHLESELQKVRQALVWANNDIQAHNRSLEGIARQDVAARRTRLLENQNLVASLGYQLRQRENAPQTYSVPAVRKKTVPVPPPASAAPFVPEPALPDATYEQVLQVLGNMVRVMEQSPEAFATMKEEDLRTHFLVQLNGQFEGRATGETFRGSGSTDILLTEADRSVFIAECKFWKGPQSLHAAIDQLLDYTTWRDAKTAILLFNRNKDYTAVVSAALASLKAHPQVVAPVTTLADTAFRNKLRHRDNHSRLIVLTTLLYNLPAAPSRSARLAPKRNPGPR